MNMDLSNWLAVVAICSLGAISPGPSLAVVIKNTLSGGRINGIRCAIGHGCGVGLYAFLCVTGLAILITGSEILFRGLQFAGAGYLLWIAIKSLLSKPTQQSTDNEETHAVDGNGFVAGFLIAFFNPKIAVFFIALFSQFVSPDSVVIEKIIYASTAAIIDGLWYVIVAVAFSHGPWLSALKRNGYWLDRFFGVLLFLVATNMFLSLI